MAEDVIFDEKRSSPAESGSKPEQENQKSESTVEDRYRISPLTLTVFRKETENGNVFRNYQLQRTYPVDDEASDFDYTSSMRPRDLRKAARLFEMAADDIQGLKKVSGGGGQ